MVSWAEGYHFLWLNEWRCCTCLLTEGKEVGGYMVQFSGLGWNEAEGGNFLTKDAKINLAMV